MSQDLGRAGYAAYGEAAGWKNYQGLPMPKWEDLTPAIRSYWAAAMAAAAAAGAAAPPRPYDSSPGSDTHCMSCGARRRA